MSRSEDPKVGAVGFVAGAASGRASLTVEGLEPEAVDAGRAAYEASRELARAHTRAAARDPVAYFGHAADGGGAPELAPICVDELPEAMGFEPRALGSWAGEDGGGVVGWQHFTNGDGSDVWIGSLEPSFDVNPRAPFVVVRQERAGGFWTAIGGAGPEAHAALAAGLPAVPIGTLERLEQIRKATPAVPAPHGPAPLALLVPGASDNGTRLHGTLLAAETWLRAQWRADIEAGGNGDYGWTFGRDVPGGAR